MFVIFTTAVLLVTGAVVLVALVGGWWIVGAAFAIHQPADDRGLLRPPRARGGARDGSSTDRSAPRFLRSCPQWPATKSI
jgi:hypothetical protein